MLRARRDEAERMGQWRRLPLLAGCTRRQLAQVDGLGTQLDVRAGRALTVEGSPARECFLVLAGRATAARGTRPVGVVGDGTVAGELALLDRTARTATVVAATPMRLLVLTPGELQDLLDVAPCIEERVLATAAARRVELEGVAGR